MLPQTALALLSFVFLHTSAPDADAQPPRDELFCVRVRDSALAPRRPPLGSPSRCSRTSSAVLACVPAQATVDGSADDTGGEPLLFDRLCYEAECRDDEPGEVSAPRLDALGEHAVTTTGVSLVCTPAVFSLTEEGKAGAGARSGSTGGPRGNPSTVTCGDANGDGSFSATDALATLRAAVGSGSCLICVCDVNDSATITATDALNLLKFAVGQAVELDCQDDGNPISWDGGGDGFSWTDPLNWSLDRIPNACDAATIVTVATVTHGSGSNGVRSIDAQSDLDLTGGTLSLRDTVSVAGLFRMRGATLAGAEILRPGTGEPLVATTSAGTLLDATLHADLDASTPSSYLNVTGNGLTVNGMATFGQGAGLYFTGTGDMTLGGTGEVLLSGPNAQLYNYDGNRLVIGPDLLVHGGGNSGIGGQNSTSQMLVQGAVACDQAAGTLNVGTLSTWSNAGTISASNGCTLVTRGPWSNTGTFQLDGASTINLGGAFQSANLGTISRSGGTLNLTGQMTVPATFTLNAATGDLRLLGGQILGGTVDAADGAGLVFTTSAGTLQSVVMNADMDFSTTSSYVNVTGNGLTVNGTATFGQGAGLYFTGTGDMTLGGTGEVLLSGPNAQLYNYDGNRLVIGPDLLVHGGGNSGIGGQNSTSQMLVQGAVACDQAAGTLNVGTLSTWSNAGTISASNGCTLVTRGPWSNTGTFQLDGASTINLGGAFQSANLGTISRSGGTLNLTGQMTVPATFTLNAATGDLRLLGGQILGGTVDAADGAGLVFTTSAGTLQSVVMNADMDFSTTSSYVNVTGNGLTVNGTATFGQGAGLYFTGTGDMTLGGTGEVLLSGPNAQLYNYDGNRLVIGPDLLVHGGGNSGIGGQNSTSQMLVQGAVACDQAAGTLNVGTLSTWSNAGTISASNGCTLVTRGPWSNTGTFQLDGASTINLGGAFQSANLGTISRSGGTLNLTGQMTVPATFTLNAATGDLRLLGGQILGGTVDAADGAGLVFTTSAGTLQSVVMNADMDFSTTSSYVNVTGNGLTVNGMATFGQGAGLYFTGTGDMTLGGTGEVLLSGPNAQLYNYDGNRLVIGPDLLVHGGGNSGIGGQNSTSQMLVQGVIDSDVASGSLNVGSVSTWSNDGTLRASAGNLTTRGPWTNDGLIEIGAGRALTATSGFAQGSAGTLTISIAGTGANDFGKVAVTGAAQLGGTLNVVLVGGYVPNLGDSFQIMTYGSATGAFATLGGLAIGGGKEFAVTVGATSVTIDVVAS